MTEEEAKTKWCPFARVGVRWMDSQAESLADLAAIAVNRGENADTRSRCLGSACMAWRWEPVPLRYHGTAVVMQSPPPAPTDGFCGLAGKP